MRLTKLTCAVAWTLLAFPASAPCDAQDGEAWREAALLAQAYGAGLQVLSIGPYAFTPRHNAPAPAFLSCDFQVDGHCRNVEPSSDPVLYAPLDLPAGALIERLVCFVWDLDATHDVSVWLAARGYPSGTSTVASVQSSGTPATAVLVQDDIEHTVLFDPQGPYPQGVPRAYQVGLLLRDDPDLGFWGCHVYWRRQVSPAPATATFTDVPTSHPFFASVEALAASGITSGCSGGDFCPNQPLTRGQMAVFLAKALGLHWPW